MAEALGGASGQYSTSGIVIAAAVSPSGARNPWHPGREATLPGEQGFLAPLGMTSQSKISAAAAD